MVLVMLVSCFVVLISGCTEEEVSKHYEADGISFNYSESWVKADVAYPGNNTTQSKLLINLADPNDPETGFCVEKHPLMGGNDLESNFEIVLKSYKNSGNNIISQNKSSIAGEDAYEILFTADSGNTHVKQKEYWCKHNNFLYTIAFFLTPENFNESQEAYNIIIKSFKFT